MASETPYAETQALLHEMTEDYAERDRVLADFNVTELETFLRQLWSLHHAAEGLYWDKIHESRG